jgi:seryl-tRNA synthetase
MSDTLSPATEAAEPTALDAARDEFRAELLASGLLVDAGQPGLYGRSGLFDDIVDGLCAYVSRSFADHHPERLRFAPVMSRDEYELTDYIVSFPQLAGTINGFRGTDAEHRELVAARARGEAWDPFLQPAETTLVSAVCHPVYERLRGTLPEGGRVIDVRGFSFRHEPSNDPMRLQAFRMQELVFIGDPDTAKTFRDTMSQRQIAGLQALGLDARLVAANDPFFGRTGRFLASNQLADEAKLEVVVPIYGDLDEGTAIASGNHAGAHFGPIFGIDLPDGTPAHSSCLAWGLERITLALIRTHGTDPALWPTEVRSELGLLA